MRLLRAARAAMAQKAPPRPPLAHDGVPRLRLLLAGALQAVGSAPVALEPPLALQVVEIVERHAHGCNHAVVRVLDGADGALTVVLSDKDTQLYDVFTACEARRVVTSVRGCVQRARWRARSCARV